jgi:DNA-binding MarR family transcriptional regulator
MSSELTVKLNELGLAMQRYQSAVSDFDREVAGILGVGDTDLRCLEILLAEPAGGGDAQEEITPRVIADRLGLTTGSVTTMLDRLERAGYVTRTRHASDRRKVLIRAEPGVRARAESMIGPLLEESASDVTTHFTDAELDVVHRFIARATTVQEHQIARLRGLR